MSLLFISYKVAMAVRFIRSFDILMHALEKVS